MPYVDINYYNDTFHGEPVEPDSFPSLYERASELIEELTLYRLTPMTFLAMPADTQERVKKAVCAQIEYMEANGGSDMDNAENIQSATIGKFSYTGSTGAGSAGQSRFSPRAERILWPTGLTYRGGRYC